MKKNLIFITLLIYNTSFGQADFCGTEPLSKEEVKKIEQIRGAFQNVSSSGITYLPVKLHFTRESGVSEYYFINQFMFEFAKLNEKFYDVGFQFYLADTINYIEGAVLDELNGSYNYDDSVALAANNKNDAINLYYVNYSNVGGRSNFTSGDKFDNWMFVKNNNFQLGETLIHEMGHYFNLYHTFESYFGYENVDGSNCSTTGDYVCDTPADVSPKNYDKISCVYTGTYKDSNGDYYTPSMTNYMSYYNGGCVTEFSAGQITRAKASHAARLSLIATEGNQYGFTYPSNDTIMVSNVRAFEHNSQLKVRWFAHTSPIGFLIERSLSPSSGFVTIGGVSGSAREFSDPSYIAGQTYYYRVKAATSKTNYSNIGTYTPSKNAYVFGSTYSNSSFKLKRMYFYDSTNAVRLLIGANLFGDEVNDFANTSYYLSTEHKYRFKWETRSNFEDSFKVWIDLNKNHIFDNEEIIARGSGEYATDSLSLDSSIKTGFYRMRFRTNWGSYAFESTDKQLYSNTYDYLLFIEGACAGELVYSDQVYGDYVSGESINTIDYTSTYPYNSYIELPALFSAPSITLNPGFLADGENTFTADTNGCP